MAKSQYQHNDHSGVMMVKGILRQNGGLIDAIKIINALDWGDIELSGRCKIEGNLVLTAHIRSKITIENCIFLGIVDFTKSIFDREVCFSGTHFHEEVKFVDASFKGRVHFDNTIFYKNIDFDFASFDKDVSFHLARFPAYGINQIIGFNNANFYGEATFSHMTFENSYEIVHIENKNALISRFREAPDLSEPWWWWWQKKNDTVSSFIKSNLLPDEKILLIDVHTNRLAETKLIEIMNRLIAGPSLFKEKCFRNIATDKTKKIIQMSPDRIRYNNRLLLANAYPKFINNIILNEIRFMGAKFCGYSNFSGSKFIKVDFRDAMFYDKTMFCYCTFVENAEFEGATFDRNSLFYNCIFNGKANFSGAIFDKEANWTKSKFSQEFLLNEAKISSMQFEKSIFEKESYIYLTDSRFDLLAIRWDLIKNHLFIEPEMDVIYLSLIKGFKELGWWKDADDCSLQYNLYKNKNEFVKIISHKKSYDSLDAIWRIKLDKPELTDLASWLCGYGIKIEYLIMPAFLLIFISGLLFNIANHQSESIYISFGNSTLLFLTGSLGNLSQPYSYVAAFEGFFRACFSVCLL